jgi:flagellar hook-length control protein FliK
MTRTTTQNATKSSTDQGKLKNAFSMILNQMALATPAQLNQLAQDPKAQESLVAVAGSANQLDPSQQAQLSDLTSLALQKMQADQVTGSQSIAPSQNAIQVAQSDEAALATSGDPGPKGRNPESTSTLQNVTQADPSLQSSTSTVGPLQVLTVSTRTQVLGDSASPLANEIMKAQDQQAKAQEKQPAPAPAQAAPVLVAQSQPATQPSAALPLQAAQAVIPAQASETLPSGQAPAQAPQGAQAAPQADDSTVVAAQDAVQKVDIQVSQAQGQTRLPDDLPVIELAATVVEASQAQQASPQPEARPSAADKTAPQAQAPAQAQAATPVQLQAVLPVEDAKADGQVQAQPQPASQAAAQAQAAQAAVQPVAVQAVAEQAAQPAKAQDQPAPAVKMPVSQFKLLKELQGSLKSLEQEPSDAASLAPVSGFKQLADDLMKEYALNKTVFNQAVQELDTLKTTSQLSIQLKPEALGKLEVTLVSEGGKLAARIVAATPEVQQALANNLPAYKQALESHGIMVQELSVSVRSDLGQGYQQQPQQQEQSWGTFKPATDPAAAVTAQSAFTDPLGYTGRLSTLA